MDVQRVKTYVQKGIQQVHGWLTRETASLLIAIAAWQDEEGIRGDCAEIGVHEGRSFCLLKNFCNSGEQAIAVDVFERQELNVDRSGCGNEEVFVANVLTHTAGNFGLLRKDSLELATRDFPNKIRIFSIDGSHTSHHTFSDLIVASSTLADGGVGLLP